MCSNQIELHSRRKPNGIGGGTRTHTAFLPADFKSASSTDSDTPTFLCRGPTYHDIGASFAGKIIKTSLPPFLVAPSLLCSSRRRYFDWRWCCAEKSLKEKKLRNTTAHRQPHTSYSPKLDCLAQAKRFELLHDISVV